MTVPAAKRCAMAAPLNALAVHLPPAPGPIMAAVKKASSMSARAPAVAASVARWRRSVMSPGSIVASSAATVTRASGTSPAVSAGATGAPAGVPCRTA